jgi:hypothetical protein
MIRLLRRLGRFPAGTETDFFDAAAEAALVSDGTAEPVAVEHHAAKAAHGYGKMCRADLMAIASERGLDVPPRSKVADIVKALEASDADA